MYGLLVIVALSPMNSVTSTKVFDTYVECATARYKVLELIKKPKYIKHSSVSKCSRVNSAKK